MALNIPVDSLSDKTGGLNLAERGRAEDGSSKFLDRRLYMQLLVFTEAADTTPLIQALKEADLPCVLYADVTNPRGVGLLTYSEDPAYFVDTLRPFLASSAFANLEPCAQMTMMGRTYAIGYESDLEDVLLKRPIRNASNADWPWAIWYPLRRSGAFAMLPAEEQRTLLMEHGGLGRAYGRADHVHDVRLASFGLNQKDSDFTIGLVGKALGPLSKMVEAMRKTRQTSEFIDSLGPFFVGQQLWHNVKYPEVKYPGVKYPEHE